MHKINNTEKENLESLFVFQKEHESRLRKLEEEIAALKKNQAIDNFKINHLLKIWWKTEMKKRTYKH